MENHSKKYSRQAEIDNLIQNAVSQAVVRRYQFLNLENDLSTLSDEEVTRIIGGQSNILGSATTVGRIPNNLF
ncbi:MAG: hypothetical protein KME21_21845 [Desmonostoc vinosum HA7617-LM4]|jgi:hypothetical protein|nr:hypothetical protein [Desmonostoc vinosum HA7617-LM4]